MPKRSKSSQRWLQRQKKDPYTRKAIEQGLASRAHFKLEQLDKKFKLLGGKMRVLELGAAPGGWTHYLAERVQRVIACDLLPMEIPTDVEFLQLDITSDEFVTAMDAIIKDDQLDLVLSDMAPNISGIRAADQAASMYLVELATECAHKYLKPGGNLVVKMFQGEGVDEWVSERRQEFKRVQLVKPDASRKDSREIYGVAINARIKGKISSSV
ncbi:MAG: RlmE family RNA methyltransferase [Pseudomonadales bacterium]|nr:RlmE family RNA methyltransferase [Pseudomonadales bacterium]